MQVSGAFEFAERLDVFGRGLESAWKQQVRQVGRDGVRLVQQFSSGPPGPNRVSGDYHRSLGYTVTDGGWGAVLYSTSPYAARLEFGFHGIDSLGRRYNQAPRPHWKRVKDQLDISFPLAALDVVLTAQQRAGL